MIGRTALTALTLLAATAAPAATVVQTYDLGFSGNFSPAPFDTSLGALGSVQFAFAFQTSYNWTATTAPGNSTPSLFLILTLQAIVDLESVNGLVNEFTPDDFQFLNYSLSSGQTVNASPMLNISGGATYTDPAILALFMDNPASISMNYRRFATDELADSTDVDSFSGSFTPITGSASFTYNYTPAIAAVPEPASWAMLIAGFALTGAVLRERRRQFA